MARRKRREREVRGGGGREKKAKEGRRRRAIGSKERSLSCSLPHQRWFFFSFFFPRGSSTSRNLCDSSEQIKARAKSFCIARQKSRPIFLRSSGRRRFESTHHSLLFPTSSLYLVQLLLHLDDAHTARHAHDLALVVAPVLDRGLDASRVGPGGGRRGQDDSVVGVVVDVAPSLRRRRRCCCRRGHGEVVFVLWLAGWLRR